MTDQFGTLVSPWQIEQAVVALLQNPPAGRGSPLLVYYLAALERASGMTPQSLPIPPGALSYRGGIDANTVQMDWLPAVHVIVQPQGDAEALDRYTYAQRYTITITATVADDDQDVSRMIAGAYGTSIAKTVVDNGSLGIGATSTVLVRSPGTAYVDPNASRGIVRSTVEFETLIAPVFTVGGPINFPDSPYTDPGGWPTVQTVNPTVTAVPVT